MMEAENLTVAAAFDLSYANLGGGQQRLFRRLGLHPGADIDAYTAAALDGSSVPVARRGLEGLYDRYLLTEPVQGRYRLQDLIRDCARTPAGQQAGAIANTRIRRRTAISTVAGNSPPPAEATVPDLADYDQALAWAMTERASLLACLDRAAAAGQHARVTALTTGIGGLLQLDGPWADGVALQTAAVQAVRQLSLANVLNDLGEARRVNGDYPGAARAQEEALGIYRDLGNRLGRPDHRPGQSGRPGDLG